MPDDLETILRLVADGTLGAEEAARIIAAIEQWGAHGEGGRAPGARGAPASPGSGRETAQARHLRVQITEGDRRVVDLRVPVSIAAGAATRVPGLSAPTLERIRAAIAQGLTGPIVDVGDEDGRVLIVME